MSKFLVPALLVVSERHHESRQSRLIVAIFHAKKCLGHEPKRHTGSFDCHKWLPLAEFCAGEVSRSGVWHIPNQNSVRMYFRRQ